MTTIAGLLLADHGTVPDVGVLVPIQDHQLTVEAVEGRKITRVRSRTTTPA